MKRSTLIIGVLCGLACVAGVLVYASLLQNEADAARNEAMARYGGEQVEVLVATRDIFPGETLSSANTEVQTWLSDLLPDECIASAGEAQGAQLASMVIEGEAISLKRFQSETASLDVPSGCVAISVPAKDVQAVGGSLAVGSRVDVYATGSTTARLGSNVLVLATNASTSESTKASVSWVTLAVPQDQSQEYVTASQSMELYFTLPADSSDESSSESKEEERKSHE